MTAPTATVLIIDDESQNRKLLDIQLRHEGYRTLNAANGDEALALIAQQAPDLILLDIMMPGRDGYQMASLLKADPATANIPIIMVTALIDRDARVAGLKAGAEEFLSKPVDRAELGLRVRNLLRLKEYGDFLRDHGRILEQQVQARTVELQRFRSAMDATADAITLVDRATLRHVEVNATACAMLGYSREELLQMDASQISPPDAEPLEAAYDQLVAGHQGGATLTQTQVRRKDGSWLPVELNRLAQRFGADWIIVSVFSDMTQRRAAEARIAYLNRVYAMLSGINTLIVRVRDRNELFREACRIAVETGGLCMAWIGLVDPGMKLVPVASAGMEGSHPVTQQDLAAWLEAEPQGASLVAQALAGQVSIVSSEAQNPRRVALGQHCIDAGILSLAVLPLRIRDETVGVLLLYAAESEFFHAEELKLLTELTGDIAFAMDHLDQQDRLNYLAYYDALTGLANRNLFMERLEQYTRSAARGGYQLALYLMDLERFKNTNDSLGQAAGDALLQQVAEWLTRTVGDASLLARIGADIFAVVLPQVQQDGDVARLLESTKAAFLEHRFILNGAVFRIAAKAGIAVYPDDGANADSLLKNAEAALKKAKASGARYLFYNRRMTEAVASKLALENRLRQALDKGEFVLHYQPKVSLATGLLTSAEALIRWNDPRSGLVPPGQFIPVLEETGLIHDVGRWALHQAVADYLRWRDAGLAVVRIAVNVSPLQLRHRDFVAEVRQALALDALAARGLELEITESLIMEDVKHSIDSLQAIRALGVSIAIDDFGTGFSSLSYLAKLPVDSLKIDRSFVVDMTTGSQGLALVSTIINLAHALKLKVVAEGVETDEQSMLLHLLGCDDMQGYLFSKPLPGDLFASRHLAMLCLPNHGQDATSLR